MRTDAYNNFNKARQKNHAGDSITMQVSAVSTHVEQSTSTTLSLGNRLSIFLGISQQMLEIPASTLSHLQCHPSHGSNSLVKHSTKMQKDGENQLQCFTPESTPQPFHLVCTLSFSICTIQVIPTTWAMSQLCVTHFHLLKNTTQNRPKTEDV